MVRHGKILASLALFALPVVAFYGCGGSDAGVSGKGTDSTVQSAKTGTLVISARFPTNGGPGELGTSLIDENTTRIEVKVWDSSGNVHTVDLTRDNPTGRISNIPIGNVEIQIRTYDSSNQLLDYLYTIGQIVEGLNTYTATLIRGSWKFVDANGNPTSIRLNKTLSSDTTTLTSFSVIPYGQPYLDVEDSYGKSRYRLLWKGSGFDSRFCNLTDSCLDELRYLNQFIGPSTNKNVLDNDRLPLPPTSDYTPTPDNPTNREAFIMGTPSRSGECVSGNFTDPDVCNYFNSRVTGSNTMEGNIAEILTKSFSASVTCYNYNGNEITCPSGTSALKSNKAMKNALIKAMSQRVGKSAIDSNGCFVNLTGNWREEWDDCADLDNDGQRCECTDLDNDGIYCEPGERSPDDWFRVVANVTWNGDACVHPFRAVGSQLPSTDLNLVIQKK